MKSLFISRVKIKNYRNFKDADVRLGHKQIIIGENNVGKTKTEKKLQTLKVTLRMSDITGDCGISYFMDQWERLLRKNK